MNGEIKMDSVELSQETVKNLIAVLNTVKVEGLENMAKLVGCARVLTQALDDHAKKSKE